MITYSSGSEVACQTGRIDQKDNDLPPGTTYWTGRKLKTNTDGMSCYTGGTQQTVGDQCRMDATSTS